MSSSHSSSVGFRSLLSPCSDHLNPPDIHLAMMSHRIPIILPTQPHAFHLNAPPSQRPQPILLSDIFDLPRLSLSIGIPILEMEDLKGPSIARRPLVIKEYGLGEDLSEMGDEDDGRGLGSWFEDPPWENLGCWSLSQTSQNNTAENRRFDAGRIGESSKL